MVEERKGVERKRINSWVTFLLWASAVLLVLMAGFVILFFSIKAYKESPNPGLQISPQWQMPCPATRQQLPK